MATNADIGKDEACSANKRFKRSKSGPCVPCHCKEDPPRCALYPAYNPNCCAKQGLTPHHVLPGHCFKEAGTGGQEGAALRTCPHYEYDDAPSICVDGGGKVGQHGKLHDEFDGLENEYRDVQQHPAHVKGSWTYAEASAAAAKAVHRALPRCSEACIKAQLDQYHKHKPKPGLDDDTRLRADSTGKKIKTLPPLKKTRSVDRMS
jgi:hypothetical protein